MPQAQLPRDLQDRSCQLLDIFSIFPMAKHLGKWQKMEKCLRIDRVHLESQLATAV